MFMKPSHDMIGDPPPEKKSDHEVTSKNTLPPRQKDELSRLRVFVNPFLQELHPKERY